MTSVLCPPSHDWHKLNLIFVRHGESNNNCLYDKTREKYGADVSEEILCSEYNKYHHHDCITSPKGQQQAVKLGEFIESGGLSPLLDLNNETNWEIISSPMTRCLLTSQEVSRGLNNKQVNVLPHFHESDGCYTSDAEGKTIGQPGQTAAEIESKYKNFKCASGMENGWYKRPHKETRSQFLTRAQNIVDWLWAHTASNNNVSNVSVSGVVDTTIDISSQDPDSATTPTDSVTKTFDTTDTIDSPNTPSTDSAIAIASDSSDSSSSDSSKERGLVIVAHGNLIGILISRLINGTGMMTHYNTGLSHLQLYVSKSHVTPLAPQRVQHIAPHIYSNPVTGQQEYRVASIQFINHIAHLYATPHLIAGNRVFQDSWIQEYIIADETNEGEE